MKERKETKREEKIKAGFVLLVGALIFVAGAFVLLRFLGQKELPIKNESKKCGIESCHGLEITCGEKVPEVCSLEYQVGDFCRNYVSCKMVGGKCVLAEEREFDLCKSCVEECEKKYQEETEKLFECENLCREKIKD